MYRASTYYGMSGPVQTPFSSLMTKDTTRGKGRQTQEEKIGARKYSCEKKDGFFSGRRAIRRPSGSHCLLLLSPLSSSPPPQTRSNTQAGHPARQVPITRDTCLRIFRTQAWRKRETRPHSLVRARMIAGRVLSYDKRSGSLILS